MPGSSLRFLGPSVKIAIPLSILWAMAFSFLTALAVQSTKTLTHPPTYLPEGFASDYVYNTTSTNPTDLVILASVELSLAIVTLVVIAILLRIDCKYDPDWPGPPVEHHGTGVGVSVIGGVGGFTMPSSTQANSERVSRVAWMV